MKKLDFKKLNYRHYIALALTLSILACTFFIFSGAFGRLIESLRDFVLSLGYYFAELFEIDHNIKPTVNNYPKIPFFTKPSAPSAPSPSLPPLPLPEDFSGFKVKWGQYWRAWASRENLILYLFFISDILFYICQWITLLVPLAVAIFAFIWLHFKKENNDYNYDTRPLRAFKRLVDVTYRPVKAWISGFINFLKETPAYYKLWLCLWLFNFNIFTILIEFVAYYIYFSVSFDFVNIYRQVYKLFLDLMPMIKFIPVFAWVIIGLIVVDKRRKKKGYAKLREFEERNKEFIDERSLIIMLCGKIGKGKSLQGSDISLSAEVMLRDEALKRLFKNSVKFPNFPWVNFENDIKRLIEMHTVFNLTTARRWVRRCRRSFELIESDEVARRYWEKHRRKHTQHYDNLIFDYDYKRYGLEYDNSLEVKSIWDILETYAQLYFIYLMQGLVIANYSIRTDGVLIDKGNFPLWDSDFFERRSREMDEISKFAYIIDFDALRLGKQFDQKNPNKDFFEFGVIVITEVGKERGNTKTNSGQKKTDNWVNQANDFFNEWLKLVRHSATVDGFPFVRVITDEQRPTSWGADARELCEIIHIRDVSKLKLAMPFFAVGELIHDLLYVKFERLYQKYRHNRGDNTLLMHLIKCTMTKFNAYYERIYNTFSFKKHSLQLEDGAKEGTFNNCSYYICAKKAYAKRYATDCFGDFFAEKVLRSGKGLADIVSYSEVRAKLTELELQHSIFINELRAKLVTSTQSD